MTEQIREAVAVFHAVDDLEAAVEALESAGFDRADISLLAPRETVEEKLNQHYSRPPALENDPEAPRVAFVSRPAVKEGQGLLAGGMFYIGAMAATGAVVASGGTFAAAIAAAAAAGGAGGLLGTLAAKLLGERHARYLQEQIDAGGIVLWVKTDGPEEEGKAVETLKRHSGAEVHVHGLPAASVPHASA